MSKRPTSTLLRAYLLLALPALATSRGGTLASAEPSPAAVNVEAANSAANSRGDATDVATVRAQLMSQLVPSSPTPLVDHEVAALVPALRTDGTWPDVDYADNSRSWYALPRAPPPPPNADRCQGTACSRHTRAKARADRRWFAAEHLRRVLLLASAHASPHSAHANSSSVAATAREAFEWWLRKDPQNQWQARTVK